MTGSTRARVVFLLAACSTGLAPATSWNFIVEPTHARVTETGDTSVMCQADVALDRCQFTVNRRFGAQSGAGYGDGPLLELSAGLRSKPLAADPDYHNYKAAYSGTGLDAGQCGITLTRIYYGWFTVGCRARALDGTWNQTQMTVFSGHEEPIGMYVTPTSALVEVGGDVSILCEAEKPLQVCRVFTPFLPGDGRAEFETIPAPNERFEYFGNGLEEGECGLTFHNVTDALNGVVWCAGITSLESRDGRGVPITVVHAPTTPQITLESSSYHDGDILRANCSTSSRPAAQITWLFGDEPLTADVSDADPAWRWPWDFANVTESVTRKLRPDDDGKKLVCVVRDTVSEKTLRAEKTVGVRDASDWQLEISPEHVHTKYPGNATVLCSAPVPLAECQIRIANDKDTSSGQRIIDFNNGYLSSPITERLRSGETIYTAEYHGKGLDRGECGVSVSGAYWGRYVVGCRARATLGQFRYNEMTIYETSYKSVGQRPVESTVSARAGANATLGCNAKGPVSKCRFYLPTGSISYKKSRPSSGRFHAGDTDLTKGECRLTVAGVTARDAGHVWCVADTKDGGEDGRTMSLVVVKAPTQPTLRLDEQQFGAGAKLRATCTALGGIPAPRITWRLGDETLRGGEVDTRPDPRWRWRHESVDTAQTLARTLKPEDDGKILTCTVHHDAWDAPVSVTQQISFRKASSPASSSSSGGSKLCPPLSSTTVDIRCNVAGRPVDCTDSVPAGTTARLACKSGYRFDTVPGLLGLTCTGAGKWDRKLRECSPDCGRRNDNSAQAVVAGGTEAKFGEFPWHGAIFYNGSSTENEVRLVCGGTLISPKFLVSAAHCFWDSRANASKPVEHYKVATGRFGLDWNVEEPDEQRRSLRRVHIHERYNGVRLNYAADIAVVELKAPFDLGWATNLICIDWTSEFEHAQLDSGTNGTVPGWGLTENDKQSATLHYVMLPFISYGECRTTVSLEYQSFITLDKICAGYKGRGTSVCQGDSGGGYVFPAPRPGGIRYYLRGIVSNVMRVAGDTARRCQTEQVSVHTRVSNYLDWLAGIIYPADPEDDDYH